MQRLIPCQCFCFMSSSKLCLCLVYNLQREAIFLHHFHCIIIISSSLKKKEFQPLLGGWEALRNSKKCSYMVIYFFPLQIYQAFHPLTRILFYFFFFTSCDQAPIPRKLLLLWNSPLVVVLNKLFLISSKKLNFCL